MKIIPDIERIKIFDDNNCVVGYVEDETLYAIDRDGYAVPVGTISHQNEIEKTLTEWRKSNLN